MRTSHWLRPAAFLAGILLAGAAACSDTSGPTPTRPPGALNIIPLPAGHDPIFNPSVTFIATKGQDAEQKIYFEDSQGNQGQEYMRFRVRSGSLLRRPDGSLINDGDTVHITITVVNPDSIQFDFQPAGLQFDPQHPADLQVEYEECGDDLDDDGNSGTPQDVQIENAMAVWRQHLPGDPYTQLTSLSHDEDFNEIEVDVFGFSRFALAY